MQMSITGHHVEVTEALRAYVEKRMARIVRHFDHLIDAHFVLSVEKLRHKADATLKIPGNDIHASAEDGNMCRHRRTRRQTRRHRAQAQGQSDRSSRPGGPQRASVSVLR